MSFNLDWTKAAHKDELFDPATERMFPHLFNLLMLIALRVGVPVVTEENLAEVAGKVWLLDLTGGPFFRDASGKPVPVTCELLRPLIGVRMNSVQVTDAVFWRGIKADLKAMAAKAVTDGQ